MFEQDSGESAHIVWALIPRVYPGLWDGDMVFCDHCGKDIPDGASFCRHCGTAQITADRTSGTIQDSVVTGNVAIGGSAIEAGGDVHIYHGDAPDRAPCSNCDDQRFVTCLRCRGEGDCMFTGREDDRLPGYTTVEEVKCSNGGLVQRKTTTNLSTGRVEKELGWSWKELEKRCDECGGSAKCEVCEGRGAVPCRICNYG